VFGHQRAEVTFSHYGSWQGGNKKKDSVGRQTLVRHGKVTRGKPKIALFALGVTVKSKKEGPWGKEEGERIGGK